MNVTIIGLMHMAGIGKESKRPYDMARLYVLSPLENVQNDSMTRKAAGFEAMEIDLAKEAVPLFLNQSYPLKAELKVDMLPRAGKLSPVVTGFVNAESAARLSRPAA